MNLERLQDQIGYFFGDRAVLLQSLTHTSYGHEFLADRPIALRNNERLEFLGDAVLDVVISDILLEAYPEANEGQLSKMRAALVNEKTLAEIAKSVDLHLYLRLGKGEDQSGGREKASIISSTFEALIAAIYLDGGFHAIYPVVRFLFGPLLKSCAIQTTNGSSTFVDSKSQLQEMTQAKWKTAPTYHLLATHGPDHAKVFEVEVRMKDQILAVAQGSSKKEAEQKAALAAIQAVQ